MSREALVKDGQSGVTLIAVLVAVALGAGVCAVLATLLTNSGKLQNSLSAKASLDDVRGLLLDQVDCPSTLAGSACPGTVALKHLKHNGTVTTLTAASGTKIGPWTVRAECSPGGTGILVRATTGRPDPLTGRAVAWTDPQSLVFGTGAELCSFADVSTHHSAASNKGINATNCYGSIVNGGYCSGYWYKDITFPTPFAKTPVVTVHMVEENTQCLCGCTSDAMLAEPTRITARGFRMICATTPTAASCPGVGWDYANCTWTAYEH